ncbi:MAG: DNA-binding protein [Butyrivibrio sp.]|nr:DNA-binding protein [Butyrivibrio sp.]
MTYEDFLSFTKYNIVDTSDSCMILECSRQNLAYMVKQEQLTPLKEDVKGNLYLKKDVLKLRW